MPWSGVVVPAGVTVFLELSALNAILWCAPPPMVLAIVAVLPVVPCTPMTLLYPPLMVRSDVSP